MGSLIATNTAIRHIGYPQLPILTNTQLLHEQLPILDQHLNNTCYSLTQPSNEQKLISMLEYRNSSVKRQPIENYIKNIYFKCHQATLTAFMPILLASYNSSNILQGCVGIRHLAAKPIFLEQYLQQPIDVVISDIAGRAVNREQIAEVGNLACSKAGISRDVIKLLVHYFSARQVQFAVCTGTDLVRAVLSKLGIEFQLIEKADANKLKADKDNWGSYYQHNPCVVAINIKKAMATLGSDLQFQCEQ